MKSPLAFCVLWVIALSSLVRAESPTEATSPPDTETKITIKCEWPDHHKVESLRLRLQDTTDHFNTIESVVVTDGTATFKTPYRKGLRLEGVVTIEKKTSTVTELLDEKDMVDGIITWKLPLREKFQVRVLGKSNKKPMAGVYVVARGRDNRLPRGRDNRVLGSGHTDAQGIVILRLASLKDVTLTCERFPLKGSSEPYRPLDPPRIRIPDNTAMDKLFDITIPLPKKNFNARAILLRKTTESALGMNAGYMLLIPKKTPKYGPANYLGSISKDGIADFVNIPDGDYRLQFINAVSRQKYITISPTVIQVRNGKADNVVLKVKRAIDVKSNLTIQVIAQDTRRWIDAAVVQIAGIDHSITQKGRPKSVGMVSFTDLPAGRYRIIVEAKGYRTFHGQVETPGPNIQIPMVRSYTLTIKSSTKENAFAAVLYQNDRGRLKEKIGRVEKGKATVQVSGVSSTAAVLVLGRDGSAGGQFLDLTSDATIDVKLLESKEVSIPIEGDVTGITKNTSLLFLSVRTPLLIRGRVDRQTKHGKAKLPSGTYDVYLRGSKAGYVRIAENWLFDQATPVKHLSSPKKLAKVLTLGEVFEEFLKKNGRKSVRPKTQALTSPPAKKVK